MAVIGLLCPGFVTASENPEIQNRGLTNSLQANRSLLDEYQNEYIAFKKIYAANPSRASQRKLKNIEDKIRALEEDSEELRSFLPLSRQAGEFIRDLVSKKKREAASSPRPETTYQMHERALKYVSENKFREAVKLYEDIVMKNPDDDEAYLIMGHTYLLMGQYQKAERAFHNAVNIDPENIREITPFYENTALQNPDSDTAHANLGYAFLIVGEAIKARGAFLEALQINPQNEAAQNGLRGVERLINNQ